MWETWRGENEFISRCHRCLAGSQSYGSAGCLGWIELMCCRSEKHMNRLNQQWYLRRRFLS